MGSLLDQLKGGMSKPGKGAKSGGSKAKKRTISIRSKALILQGAKRGQTDRPRTQTRAKGSKSIQRT